MVDKEKLKQYDRLERSLLDKWLKTLSERVDNEIPDDTSVLEIEFPSKGIGVTIWLNNEGVAARRFEVDNENVFAYITNHLYFDKPKSVHFYPESSLYKITFDESFYKEVENIWNNKDFQDLKSQLFSDGIFT